MLNMKNTLDKNAWALLHTPELVAVLAPNLFLSLYMILEHIKETGLSQINLKLL